MTKPPPLTADDLAVLACLPIEPQPWQTPGGAVVREIAEETGLGRTTIREVILEQSLRRHFHIRRFTGLSAPRGCGTQYAIARCDWPAAQALLGRGPT